MYHTVTARKHAHAAKVKDQHSQFYLPDEDLRIDTIRDKDTHRHRGGQAYRASYGIAAGPRGRGSPAARVRKAA
jgi:hypothetical protein